MAPGFAQGNRLAGMNYVNHVAISVANFDEAFAFYTQKMGFREAFTVRDDKGQPLLAYVQASRNTFVELQPANANRPPSTDPPWVKPHTSSTPKGTPGARPGHLGHRQALLEPTEVIEVQPPACGCGQTAFPDAHPYYTHQVIELPDIQMTVQHFVLESIVYRGCEDMFVSITC